MKRLTLWLACLFISMGLAIAQNKTVSGTVIDEAGEPVIGASVVVKGNATVGTVTDLDGKFTLSVPASATTLVVKYLGMQEQEVAIASNVTVTLHSSDSTLDEVIVVAYGTAKKSSFTGSATVMKSDAIEKRQVSNVTNALAGQISGVQATQTTGQPGTTSTIRIRGIGSLSSGNSPLYVVDGVPYDGDISSINTADIESVTVLKDAASSALYGARGANGVILITTKKGSTGEAKVSVDAKWGTNRRAVPNYDVLTDPATYYEKFYQALYNATAAAATPEVKNQTANTQLLNTQQGGLGYLVYTIPNGEKLIGMDGKLNPKATLGYSDGTYYYTPDKWFDELFNKGNLRQEYNVNVSGGKDKLTFFVSGGYLDDSGIISGSSFKRYSTRAKVDYEAKKWLKVGANISYTNFDLNSPANQTSSGSSANVFNIANIIAPIYPFYVRDAQKNIYVDDHGFTVYDYGNGKTGNFMRPTSIMSNPAMDVSLDKRQYLADVFSGRWYAEVEFIEGLKFKYNLGLDVDNTSYRRLYNKYYGQYSEQGGVGGIIYVGSMRTTGINQQQLLTYKKTFDNIHHLDVLAGHESYKYRYSYLNASREKIFSPDVVELNNGINQQTNESYTNHYAIEGYLARVLYDYDEKYFASASYRRDASSRFHPDNRWGNFGSLGLAWAAHKESFLSDQTWINELKYKISYGQQGNDNLLYKDGITTNYYPYQDQYKLVNNNGSFANSLYYKGNKDITWETSHSFNTGFDFNLWDEKLYGTIEYFARTTSDMLYYMPVALNNGYTNMPKNVGSVRNSGWEFDLHSTVFKTNDIKINLYANATLLKNKIIKLDSSLNGQWIDGSRIYKEGESMYQFYMRKYAGVDETTGQALYYKDVLDANGNITGTETTDLWNTATQYSLGDILPKVYGGFGINADFYGFDLAVAFNYQFGGKFYDNSYAQFMHGGNATNAGINWHKDILNAWTPENTQTNVPRLNSNDTYTNSMSNRFLISSDYLDIRNITLGYNLPKKLLQKAQVGKLRIFVSGENLALFSARQGIDPRQSFTAGGGYMYSAIRTLSGGININF